MSILTMTIKNPVMEKLPVRFKRGSLITVCFTGMMLCCCLNTSAMPETLKQLDTLNYSYQTFKQRAPDCGRKPDSSCTVVKIKYPLFNSREKLNDTVYKSLVALFSVENKTFYSLQQASDNFIYGYQKSKKDNPQNTPPYALDAKVNVVTQTVNLVTLKIQEYVFQGGAHPGEMTGFINWDTRADKKIALKDLFITGYRDQLNEIAERIFRQQEKLSESASLADNYFFKDNKFSLNNTFLITPAGILFFYNEYEIKSYAEGPTQLLIPYAKIKFLLRPNTIISPYLK